MICNHRWMAPYLMPPPSKQVQSLQQFCVLEKGHTGDHRSNTKVTTPNKEQKDG